MKEEDKYYTPTFEDFIPNLEYEYFDGREWVKKVYDNLEHRASETMNLHYQLKLNKDRFRVKYLDKVDLYATGLIDVSRHDRIIFESKEYKWKRYSNHIARLIFNRNIHANEGAWVLIVSGDEELTMDDWETRFAGHIKNKTELKRLLKQLGL